MNNSSSSNGTMGSTGAEITTSLSIFSWSIAFGVLAVMAIFGNIAVILAFTRNIKLHTRANYIIVGLSTADLLVGSIAVPLYIGIIVLYARQSEIPFLLSVIYHAVDIFGGFASIFHLIIISLERFYAIAFPVNHRNSSKVAYRRVLMICWVASASLAVIHSTTHGDFNITSAFFIIFCVCFVTAFIVICAAYFGIWKRTTEKKLISKRALKRHQREMMIATSLLIVIVVFVLTWLPFFCINAIFFFEGGVAVNSIPFEVVQFTKLLHYSNSAINPVIYSLRIPGFKKTFTSFMRRESTRSFRLSAVSLSRHKSTKNDQRYNMTDMTLAS